MKQWRYIFALTLLLCAVASPSWAAPSLQVTVANQGWVRSGGWASLVVELVNDGRDLTADLVVTTAYEQSNAGTAYVVPVALPAGATKRVPVYLPIHNSDAGKVTLVQNGKPLAESKFTLSMLGHDRSLVGVLSSDELGVPGLSTLTNPMSPQGSLVIRLDAEGLGDRAAMLQMYSVIALSRTDTSALNEAQLRSLEGWVGGGGTLLLVGGPEWKRTFQNLPDSLRPVTITGVQDSADLSPLGQLAGAELNARGPISVATVDKGEVLAQADGVPLIVSTPVGVGRVIYLAADPALTPLAGWTGQSDLMQQVIGMLPVDPAIYYGDPLWQIRNILQRMENLAMPSLGVIAFLLFAYLLLVGPVNYFVLKRMDRRELAWVTVPLLSVVIVGASYGVGFGRQSTMITRTVSATELFADTGAATMTTYVGVYAPSQTVLRVEVPGATAVVPYSGPSGIDGRDRRIRVVQGEKTRIEFQGMDNYSLQSFSMEHDLNLPGALQVADLRVEGGTVTLRIKNGLELDLQHLTLLYDGRVYPVGHLQAGATSSPVTVSLFGSSDLMKTGAIDAYLLEQHGVDYELGALAESVLAHKGYGNTGALVAMAWTEQSVGAIQMPELGTREDGPHLLYTALRLPMESAKGYSSAMTTVARQVAGEPVYYGGPSMILEPGRYEWVLHQPGLDRESVTKVILHLPGYYDGTVQVKDQQTGQWVSLPAFPTGVDLDPDRFMTERSQVEIGLDVEYHRDIGRPALSTKGGDS